MEATRRPISLECQLRYPLDDPWSLGSVEEEYIIRIMGGIVDFELPIKRMEANFRLLQNRPTGDRRRIADALSQLSDMRAQGASLWCAGIV